MVGDGDSTEDISLPLVFLFSHEGAVLTAALEEHHNVDVLLLPKERQLGHGEDKVEGEASAGNIVFQFGAFKKQNQLWISYRCGVKIFKKIDKSGLTNGLDAGISLVLGINEIWRDFVWLVIFNVFCTVS